MANVYEIVTEKVVTALENGTVPWRKPWASSLNGPRNYISGKPYRGVNVFLLLVSAADGGYTSPYWLTRKQINERGGKIVKGEKSTLIVFFKTSRVEDKQTGETKTIPLLRYYLVWNLEQTEGVAPIAGREPTEQAPEFAPLEAAEKIMAGYPDAPSIRYAGDQAYYDPTSDAITLPPRDAFTTPEEFYSTAFHEMTHSTGHADRCARPNWATSPFGSHDYGREELVAEMGSAFLAAEAGILVDTIDNSAAYLRSWVKTIQADPRAVVVAAGKAQAAADHILGRPAPVYDAE